MESKITSFLKRLLQIAAFTAVYYLSARLSLTLAFQNTNASPVWPPSGIAFAVLLIFSRRLWPGIFLGAFLANTVVFLTNNVADLLTTVIVSANIGIGNTLEAVCGVTLMQRMIGLRNPFDQVKDVFKFTLVAMVMCLVSSAIGPFTLIITRIVPPELFPTVWFTWWMGDMAGVLSLSALLLAGYKRPATSWIPPNFVEFSGFLILLFSLLFYIFGGQTYISTLHYPMEFLLFPLIVWSAFRYGQVGVGIAIISTAIVTILGTIHGHGPFIRADLNESLLLLEAFIGVITMLGLILTAALNERQHAQEELKKALAIKDEFTSTVSHELRTPLAISKEALSLLMRERAGPLTAKQREIMSIANTHLDRLGILINDILDFSKTEAKKMELDKQTVNIITIVKECCEGFKLQIQKKGITFVLSVPETQIIVSVDRLRFIQILSNLINNAFKFTPIDGRIEVKVTDRPTECQFTVSDSGPGIAPEDLGNLFKKFSQLRRKYGPGAQGTGLGLSIAKSLVELHGGEIHVESYSGKGASFIFTIPKKDFVSTSL